MTLIRNRAFFEAVISAQNDAVIMYDNQKNVQRVNPAFLEIYGFNPIGLHVTEIMKRVSCRSLDGLPLVLEEQPTPQALEGKKVIGLRFIVTRADGNESAVEVSSGPIRQEDQITGAVTVWHDITEQMKNEEALRESEARFRGAFDNSAVAMTLTAPDGTLLRVNSAMCQLVGYSEVELAKRTFAEITHPDDLPVNLEGLKSLNNGSIGNFRMEKRYIHKDGRFIWVDMSTSTLRDAQGDIRYFITYAQDITKRKQAELLLAEKAQQMEVSNKELESFSYSISHDLKAPLRAIEGYSRMILKKDADKLSEETILKLEVIRNNTERMNILIDGLLSFSKALKSSIEISEIDMDKLVREVWADIQAANADRELEIKITDMLPGKGDSNLVRQVLVNLLSNAIKFTKTRKPGIIEVSCHRGDDDVVYCIKDNGAGFDMAYSDRLFGVFQRLHSHEEYEGTGIGLALVHRIIVRHGGRVWAESEVGKGATFYFTLSPGAPLR